MQRLGHHRMNRITLTALSVSMGVVLVVIAVIDIVETVVCISRSGVLCQFSRSVFSGRGGQSACA